MLDRIINHFPPPTSPPVPRPFRRRGHRRNRPGRSSRADSDQPGCQHLPVVRQPRPGVHLIENHQHTVLVRVQVRHSRQQSRLPDDLVGGAADLCQPADCVPIRQPDCVAGSVRQPADCVAVRQPVVRQQWPAAGAVAHSHADESVGCCLFGGADSVPCYVQQRAGSELRLVDGRVMD